MAPRHSSPFAITTVVQNEIPSISHTRQMKPNSSTDHLEIICISSTDHLYHGISFTYHLQIIYMSTTYHLPGIDHPNTIYRSSTYHLNIIYISSIYIPSIYNLQIICRSSTDHTGPNLSFTRCCAGPVQHRSNPGNTRYIHRRPCR